MKRDHEVKAWIRKAVQDYVGACILARQRKKRVPDLACFHSHQAAEKYLKGFLAGEKISFPKTHDLPSLKALCSANLPEIELLSNLLFLLNRFGVLPRYPGDEATASDAKRALSAIKEVRKFFALRLPGISGS